MLRDLAETFRPVAPPQLIDNAYSNDQHSRLLNVVRDNGPWPLILAENFKTPEEVIATTSGAIPEGVTLTWDMIGLNPVFRGYLARGGTCFYPEIEDCYYNSRFLELVRNYWGCQYAEPETFLFNIQGPTPIGGPPHLDGTVFRGMTMENTPLWLLLTMAKSRLFDRWRSKKGQVIAWYYNGRIGGGFNCWPDGPSGQAMQINAPMWGKAVVVENEMMFHHGQATGPVAQRKPQGMDISTTFGADPENPTGWQLATSGKINQKVAEQDMRFLVHWGARLFKDMADFRQTYDHSDDIGADQAINMLIADMKTRGVQFVEPTDPLHDNSFVALLSQVYDIGGPSNIPADAMDEAA
ncbi:hypothetical protein [Sphingomonas bisphenolicum]|uniref:Uncharacterized protein n=1 Tax=Sphingomonas bisphenolicum TaxID=296544 RepID=A0ABM7G535_9SPHN|nr:hypothetical protein [Sphingomonas bisphenolicum]BBF69720.1 hypothetical protein SBA_ch1_19200 [Sphingomonas bisphenolicum]